MTWWFTTFMAPAIKQKVHNLPGVEYLYEVMPPDQLEIPAYITEYDMTVNSKIYFWKKFCKEVFCSNISLFFTDKWPEVLSTGTGLIIAINVHVTRRKSWWKQRSVKIEAGSNIPCVLTVDCSYYYSDIGATFKRESHTYEIRDCRYISPTLGNDKAKSTTLSGYGNPRFRKDNPSPQ